MTEELSVFLLAMKTEGNINHYIPLIATFLRDVLAEEPWPGYHYAHDEADNEGYQNEDDERLRIDEHRSFPFSADPDILEKEQSIIRDDATHFIEEVVPDQYFRSIRYSYAPNGAVAKSPVPQLWNKIFSCL